METLSEMGTSESTTFVLPQELTSLVGRYGKHLTGSDIKENGDILDSLDFGAEDREMLGLDDIEEILGQIDEQAEVDTEAMEEQAQKVKQGADDPNIKSADAVIEEMDESFDPNSDPAGGEADVGSDSSQQDGQ